MGLDIDGNTLTLASAVLTIGTASGSLNMRTAGGVARPSQPLFVAFGNQAAGWTNFADATWNKISFNTVSLNVNGCYSGVNSRFTAPVTGTYFFQASCYLLKNGASDAYYWHPMFGVNGLVAGAAANGQVNYRIRGHGVPIGSYHDSHITETYQLTAGDYVEHYIYSTGAPTNQIYPPYQRFTGLLLG